MGWAFLPAYGLWRMKPFQNVLSTPVWRQAALLALLQTFITAVICFVLGLSPQSQLLWAGLLMCLLQTLLLLLSWPLLWLRQQVKRADPLRERI